MGHTQNKRDLILGETHKKRNKVLLPAMQWETTVGKAERQIKKADNLIALGSGQILSRKIHVFLLCVPRPRKTNVYKRDQKSCQTEVLARIRNDVLGGWTGQDVTPSRLQVKLNDSSHRESYGAQNADTMVIEMVPQIDKLLSKPLGSSRMELFLPGLSSQLLKCCEGLLVNGEW